MNKDIQAIGASIQNMLLVSYEQGLGTCWLGEITKNEIELKMLLGVKDNLKLMAVIALGHIDSTSVVTKRRDVTESIVVWR